MLRPIVEAAREDMLVVPPTAKDASDDAFDISGSWFSGIRFASVPGLPSIPCSTHSHLQMVSVVV